MRVKYFTMVVSYTLVPNIDSMALILCRINVEILITKCIVTMQMIFFFFFLVLKYNSKFWNWIVNNEIK